MEEEDEDEEKFIARKRTKARTPTFDLFSIYKQIPCNNVFLNRLMHLLLTFLIFSERSRASIIRAKG